MKEVLLRLDHHAAKSLRSTESQQVNLNRCPTEQHLEETQRRWLAQICQDWSAIRASLPVNACFTTILECPSAKNELTGLRSSMCIRWNQQIPSEDCGSSTGLATIAPSQMQFLHSQSRSCGSGAAGTSVSTQSKQHSHVAQALSTLEAGSGWQPKQLSGQVNKLTI